MEANIQIKKAEVEGNKVKNLEFYGDWEIDMGEGGGTGPIYINCPMNAISANTWKAGLFNVTVNSWTSIEHIITLTFNSGHGYKNASFVELYTSNSKSPRTTISGSRSIRIATAGKTIYGIFTGGTNGGMDNMIGYIFLDVNDGTDTFEYTEV